MLRKRFAAALMAAALATAVVSPVLAQNAPPGGPGGGPGGPGGPGGGGFNWQDMQARREQQLKEQLGVNDEEWNAIKPKIDKVNLLRFQTMAGRFGGFGGRGPGGGGPGGGFGGNMPSNPIMDAARELQQVLQDQNASPELIKAKLQALRDAKAKAQEQLVAAQNELKDLLTVRQEAVLVGQGTLD